VSIASEICPGAVSGSHRRRGQRRIELNSAIIERSHARELTVQLSEDQTTTIGSRPGAWE
jgi:hypothetical protein